MLLRFSRLSKAKKAGLTGCLLSFVLLFGIAAGYLSNHVFSENGRFQDFTEEIFRTEASGSTLTLHYALAQPKKLGISLPKATLGRIQPHMDQAYEKCQEYEKRLKSFDTARLSKENNLTLDMLLLYFHNQASLKEVYLLEEPLSPSLGIQAQLPILLAEYAFYEKGDVSDYLNLLTDIRPYFQSILDFEKAKAESGLFMGDAALNGILSQCSAFIQNPEENYMQEVFEQRLSRFPGLSDKDRQRLSKAHKQLLKKEVIPAYQMLMEGLSSLRGSGKNSKGLSHLPGGKAYYEYLIRSQGIYTPVSLIQRRLTKQLMEDSKAISLMLKEQPSLSSKLAYGAEMTLFAPQKTMEKLQQQMEKDFPALPEVSYEIRYVHKSMEAFLSPAFYLTPPLDRGGPNVIYINQAGDTSHLELFATLAHEGFPGHLYQTVTFGRQNPDHIRYLLSFSGYVEGWATYIESFAYRYAAPFLLDEAALDLAQTAWLNRSVNLCIYSLMDIGIHYHGWDMARAAVFLNAFGIRDASVAAKVYQYIVETPANYLKYYAGYLSFLDLRSACQKREGEGFDLKEFHETVLKIGPVPFPVLEKYLPQFSKE